MFAAIAHVRSYPLTDLHTEALCGDHGMTARGAGFALCSCRQLRYLSPHLALQTGSFASPPHDGYALCSEAVERALVLISTCHQWQTRGNSERAIKVNRALTSK